MKTALTFAAALLTAAALSGCYEAADEVALHQPGVYTGKRDSDAILHPDEQARAALQERFRLGQTDR